MEKKKTDILIQRGKKKVWLHDTDNGIAFLVMRNSLQRDFVIVDEDIINMMENAIKEYKSQ